MPSNGEVPDPTDWIGTPLSSLSSLESALQCHVCKELFTTPMITSCSHTFCSLCIRRCLSQDGRCPACRSGDQESKLRRNWAMEECVHVFQEQRGDLLRFARNIAEKERSGATDGVAFGDDRPSKRRRTQKTDGISTTSETPTMSTRSRSRMALQASQENGEHAIVEDSEDDGSQYCDDDSSSIPMTPSAELVDRLAKCPVCKKIMKLETVDPHLDQCMSKDQPPTPRKVVMAKQNQSVSLAYNAPSPTKARQRLGALNYSLLTEAALKRKLSEIGIPAHGSKSLMQRRHIEWMNLWNASCDSTKPKTKRELLRELETWDRTQGRQIANVQGPVGVMAKDFDAEGWTKSNKDEFAALIKKARPKSIAPLHTDSRDPGLGEEVHSQSKDQEPYHNLDHTSMRNDIVDLASAAETPLEQQPQSQSSQMSGVAA